jgi:hypothetical protein
VYVDDLDIPPGKMAERQFGSSSARSKATVRLIDRSAFSSDARTLSTTTLRTSDPFAPVNPSCSELFSVSR